MGAKLYLSGVIEESIVDGPGLRFVLFTQGCPHHCRGCHNPETQSFTGGYFQDVDEIFDRFSENPLLAGITFSGGEPFHQPEPLIQLADRIHAVGKTVVTYTGYVFEQLFKIGLKKPVIQYLLDRTDLLIDGPFIESLKDLELVFRGSSNQRLLDQKKCQGLIKNIKLPLFS